MVSPAAHVDVKLWRDIGRVHMHERLGRALADVVHSEVLRPKLTTIQQHAGPPS